MKKRSSVLVFEGLGSLSVDILPEEEEDENAAGQSDNSMGILNRRESMDLLRHPMRKARFPANAAARSAFEQSLRFEYDASREQWSIRSVMGPGEGDGETSYSSMPSSSPPPSFSPSMDCWDYTVELECLSGPSGTYVFFCC